MTNQFAIAKLNCKQPENVGAICNCKAQIVQAKHDLAHGSAVMRILEGSDNNKRRYIAGRGFFDKGEIAKVSVHVLSDGDMNTREIAERVMCEKDLDPSDTEQPHLSGPV